MLRIQHDLTWLECASRPQVYVREITDYVGTSGVDFDLNTAKGVVDSWTYPAGDFVDIIKPPVCPPGGMITPFSASQQPLDLDCDKMNMVNTLNPQPSTFNP